MELAVIKLTNLSPLHLGNGTEAYENAESVVHSDMLVSALASLRAAEGRTDDLASFIDSFALSNAFPYMGDTYFLPAPKGRLPIDVRGENDDAKIRKTLKKIAFVDKLLFEHIINGQTVTVDKSQIQGQFLFASPQQENVTVMETQVRNRATVPRNGNSDTTPFPFAWTFFAENAGLYFLTDAHGELLKEIVHLTAMLGQEGLGTDRSVGGGHFDVEPVSSWKFALPSVPDSQLLLSFYIPTQEELSTIDLANSKYTLIERSGYMSGSTNINFRHLRRKHIFGFTAGSKLSTTITLKGKVVDVRPEWSETMHPVYRSGRIITIPCNLK